MATLSPEAAERRRANHKRHHKRQRELGYFREVKLRRRGTLQEARYLLAASSGVPASKIPDELAAVWQRLTKLRRYCKDNGISLAKPKSRPKPKVSLSDAQLKERQKIYQQTYKQRHGIMSMEEYQARIKMLYPEECQICGTRRKRRFNKQGKSKGLRCPHEDRLDHRRPSVTAKLSVKEK